MSLIRIHKRPAILAQLFCLALMALLLANPVIAMVAASMDCDGQCRCCDNPGPGPTGKIIGNTDIRPACCGPTGSKPCHMTASRLPDARLVLIHTTIRAHADTVPMLISSGNAGMSNQSHPLSISTRVTDTTLSTPPLYLQSCRLNC